MFKKYFKYFFLVSVLTAVSVLGIYYFVENQTKDRIYTSTTKIPKNKVGVVLGTGKFTSRGHVNLFYKYRIEATLKLYKAGKIEYVLVSGDNSRKDYDEPSLMKEDLVKGGIPENKIFLDYAGFRTLDSVVRANKVFGQDSFTIISQKFHNERAVFIAENKNLNVVGFNAREVSSRYSIKTVIREYFARTKMVLDLTFNVQPKFLGDPIKI
ncbi:vancomycin high temperature exclusion protein [Aureivirga sp. CE67]|uniref:SanA/YdcF family protein n=1 Tax=Aureivirga sp. CE67 TaxID=1788983 RepID=UPI0018C90960|nr:ElyC/SanA/YdcF family protein [Aureivirga sp. CE67]